MVFLECYISTYIYSLTKITISSTKYINYELRKIKIIRKTQKV